MKINKRKVARNIIVLLLMFLTINTAKNFAEYPERYVTTWKYQLQKDIEKGDDEAIAYYSKTYLEKGIDLFN